MTPPDRPATDYVALLRPALSKVRPYRAGKPIEDVEREFGLDRVVKLASNEGPWGPVPRAIEALERAATRLNRYPDPGGELLRNALADHHQVSAECIVLGAGADGVIDCLSQATLDPGDEIVCGWPTFPSYVGYAAKQGAAVRSVPLRDHKLNLGEMLAAITPNTKLVYLCYPNNPTGTINGHGELKNYFDLVPDHVLTVIDQAYFEYVDEPDYADAIVSFFKPGKRVLILRTFSKIYGLAALRIGYGVTSPELTRALTKTRRAFDIAQPGLDAARASLGDGPEIAARRERNSASRDWLISVLRSHGFSPVVPGVANFIYTETAFDAEYLFQLLLKEGVIIRPLGPFGAPKAIRVTVGTPDEIDFLDHALAAVHPSTREGQRNSAT
jgi:histidinol-phosphate aminotransferase